MVDCHSMPNATSILFGERRGDFSVDITSTTAA